MLKGDWMSSLPIGLFGAIHLGWEIHEHIRGFWDIQNTDLELSKSKWLVRRNPEENALYKWLKLPQGYNSLSESIHVSSHSYCTLFNSTPYIMQKLCKLQFAPHSPLFQILDVAQRVINSQEQTEEKERNQCEKRQVGVLQNWQLLKMAEE